MQSPCIFHVEIYKLRKKKNGNFNLPYNIFSNLVLKCIVKANNNLKFNGIILLMIQV